jgi:putative ABC transport system permease protein
MNNLFRETRQAIRGLFRNPGFTIVAVLTMALGIGINTAMFCVIENVLLRPLPYHNPSSIVMLWSSVPKKNIQRNWTSYPDIQDWRRQSHSFDQIAAIFRVDTATTVSSAAQVERIAVTRVSSGLFSILGVAPQLGRSWTTAEEERRASVAIISHAFWQTHFGGDSSIIGRSVEIDHKPETIVGVMPADFDFPAATTEAWMPLSSISEWPAYLTARQADAFNAVAQLKSGVTPQQAQEEMTVISARLNAQYPQYEAGKSVNVVPLSTEFVGSHVRASLWMLFGSVLFILMIACMNVASLVMARQTSHEKEYAVRLALGASRARLLRLQLIESLILCFFAVLPGLGLAAVAIPLVRAYGPIGIRGLSDLHLNSVVLIFCVLLSFVTGLIFGFVPAWLNLRRDPNNALKAGSRTMIGNLSHRRLGGALITLQLTLATILLTGAGLMVRSFLRVQAVDLGYRSHGLLFLHLDVPTEPINYTGEVYTEALDRIRALPGVKHAAAIDALFSDYVPDDIIVTDGHQHLSTGEDTVASSSHVVSMDYFETAGIPLLRGRSFASIDDPHGQPVAVINHSMATQFWPGGDPLGKRFRFGVPGEPQSDWRTVIGVVGDTLPDGRESRVFPQFYLSLSQTASTGSMDIIVRTSQGQLPMANGIRTSVLSVNHNIPRFAITTVDTVLDELGNRRTFQTWLLSSFSIIALILAAIGIYGLISYSATERTPEIAIRMALGADRMDIMRMVLGHVMFFASIGLVLGLGSALLLSHAASSLLFGVGWTDSVTLTLATASLLLVSLVAGYIPARRAMNVEPVTRLSSE